MNALLTTEWLPEYLVPFFTLSYPTPTPKNPDSFPTSSYYRTGPKDLCLIVTIIAVMAILRDAFRLGVFEPFARWQLTRALHARKRKANDAANGKANGKANGHSNGHANGHTKGNGAATDVTKPTPKELRKIHRSVLRFAEQGWPIIYYPILWSTGLYIHLNLPTRILEPTSLWQDYPHIPIAGTIKLFYLTQTAFYLHQILILNAEARRKDHVQMMTHHVITAFLIGFSYFTNYTRVGSLILVLMDWCDIFLPLAKMIRYIEFSQFLCDLTFGWFLVSWLVTRHVLFMFPIISSYIDGPRLIPFKWSVEEGHYLSRRAWIVFVTCLSALQVLQIVWFGMICRVAYRVVTKQGAADVRSDDESDDDKDD